MPPKYYCHISETPSGCEIALLVSPQFYSKTISQIIQNTALLAKQLEMAKLTFTPIDKEDYILLERTQEDEIEAGADIPDMRLLVRAKTTASKPELEKRLKNSEFFCGELPEKRW